MNGDKLFCICAGCKRKSLREDGLVCTDCKMWFCDNCYDSTKGEGCKCHNNLIPCPLPPSST